MFISEVKRKASSHGNFRNHNEGYLLVHLGTTAGGPANKRRKFEFCHRLVLYLIFGPPPASEDNVAWECCHICSNKTCLNPVHLVWGTKGDNYANDMYRYMSLARAQGHPEDTIPLGTIVRVK